MDKIEELLNRAVDKIYPSKEELEKRLRRGDKLTLYQGFDPTGTQLHIGHMVGLRKLRQWQDLGHKVIFLIGTGTGQAGDPSGKTTARERFLSEEELRKNAKDYVMQAGKIVRFHGDNPIKITYNSDWFNNMKFSELLLYFGNFSVQQLLERDLFQERIKNEEPINLRAFLYPVLQGIDSFRMEIDGKPINGVDLEVGGTDQTFNMLRGRELVKIYNKKEKYVMTTPLLADSEGRKIGKTEGNVIGLTDMPNDLYGKIMSLSDDVIAKCFEYLTDIPMKEVKNIEKKLREGDHPMSYKKKLAYEIVKQLNTEQDAKKAQAHFERTVQDKEKPEEISTFELTNKTQTIIDVLVESGLASSKSDAKRLIDQGGVSINDKKVTDGSRAVDAMIKDEEATIQVGKRRFLKVKLVV